MDWAATGTPPPKFATPRTPERPTLGPAVAKLACLLGTPLMPWQQYVADVALELIPDPDGGPGLVFAYPDVLITVPRQSGKTTLLRPVMLHRAIKLAYGSTWMTAQTRQDARDTWEQTVQRVLASKLRRLVKVRYTNGQEAIRFPNGSALRVFAPKDSALHGKSTDLVFIDEIWSLSAEAGTALAQAFVPTMATRKMAQSWKVSTAGNSKSTWFRPMVDALRETSAGRTAADPDEPATAFFEWGVPDDAADPSDVDLVAAHHPALGHTIGRRALLAAKKQMGNGSEYARAYGNFWVSSTSYYVAPSVWEAARTLGRIAPGSDVAFAAEVFPDRSGAVIVAAGRAPDGALLVEFVEGRSGVGWLPERLMQLTRKHRPVAIVVDPYGPARSAHQHLDENRRVRVPLVPFTAADMIQADAEFVTGLVEHTVRHRSHPLLDEACRAASGRLVREQPVISRAPDPGGKFPAAVVAAMLAAYGLTHPADVFAAPAIRSA
ncbi:terminase large subunit domain-containing protein [Yinghuangia soli]|uniref:Phage terminase large subunit family protein n=1 Tax=Yinghuangia soli TaxID=2908204 RepID=A0AA41PX30_9ACTN|nr:phage terminase large subunit family protein [Yinghuangia soli]MCF2526940.1 phage terminase large subunit family protein [Yinghuangia soli]